VLPFSAYVTGYSETYNSNWDDIKYNGRSEFLYAFNSYRKTATFKLMIPIFQPDELKTKHDRLKLLQKGLAGKYSNNRLGGILTRINLGYYLYGAACIINNLTVSIPDDASWDWGVDGNSNLAYAMLLEANFQITIVDDSVVGFAEEKKEKLKPKPNPLPIPKPVIPKVVPVEIKRPKITVIPPPPKPREIPIDSTRVVKQQRLKGKGEVKKPTKPVKYGGGDFGGGGAGGDF
jgi:hypothetical protein